MIRNIIKIIDGVVAAARLEAARKRLAEHRHIARELRREAGRYDAAADSLGAAMRERFGA